MSRRGSSTSRPGAARPEDSPGTGGFLPRPLAGLGGGRRERGAGKDGGGTGTIAGRGEPQSLTGGRGGSSQPSPPEPEQWGEPAPAQAQLCSARGSQDAPVKNNPTCPSQFTRRERTPPRDDLNLSAFHELTWSPWAPPGAPRAPFLAEPS